MFELYQSQNLGRFSCSKSPPLLERFWAIQEILSASFIELRCGSKAISWTHFSTGLEAIGNIVPDGIVVSCASTPAYAIAAKRSLEIQNYSLEELVAPCSACDSQCKDIRDKIFGLVSLANIYTITPDYSMSGLDLYVSIFSICCFGFAKKGTTTHQSKTRMIRGSFVTETFIDQVYKELGYPLWNPVDGNFFALKNVNYKPISEDLYQLAGHAIIYKRGTIEKLSTPLSKSSEIDDSMLSHFPLFSRCPPRIVEQYVAYLSRALSSADFHRTTAIRALYTKEQAEPGLPNLYRASDDKGWEISTDDCRFFVGVYASEGMCGLASTFLHPGDQLCYMDGFSSLFVIRPIYNGQVDDFLLIGQAILLGCSIYQAGSLSGRISARLYESFDKTCSKCTEEETKKLDARRTITWMMCRIATDGSQPRFENTASVDEIGRKLNLESKRLEYHLL